MISKYFFLLHSSYKLVGFNFYSNAYVLKKNYSHILSVENTQIAHVDLSFS